MAKRFFILLILFVSSPAVLAGTFDPTRVSIYDETDSPVSQDADYVLEIGTDTALLAEVVTLPLKLTNPDSIDAMSLLLHYDQTALLLLRVSRLNTRIKDWEYFKYEMNKPEVGDVKILALADLPDPVSTPPLLPGEGVVVNLIFQVIFDPCPLDLSTFIRFKFTDSTDNTLRKAFTQELVTQDEIEYKDGYIFMRCPNETREDERGSTLPKGCQLFQNYPNPFNPRTEISFYLPKESEVSLIIYNIKGQVVNRLLEQSLQRGRHKVTWEGTDWGGDRVTSGVYLYRLEAEEYSATKKMILLR